jgi:beta-lactamase regulating signal transducer with metallopeptidase domain
MTLLETLWRETALHLWQTTLVLGVIALLARLLRSAPARYQHAVWWIGLAALFLPPMLFRRLGQLFVPEDAVASPVLAYASVALRPPVLTEGAAVFSHTGTIWVLLTVAWALGVVWLLGRGVTGSRRAVALFPRGLDLTADPAEIKVLAAITGTDIPPRCIHVGEAPIVPSVIGLLHPRILVPRRVVDALEPEELRSILIHEDCHRRRRDPLLAVLLRTTVAVFFFYPPAWWLARRLRDSAEIVCDAAVLDAGVTAETYSRALARTLSLDLLPESGAAAGLGKASCLGQRLDRIDHPWRYRVLLRHRMALAAAAVTLAAVSCLPFDALDGVGAVHITESFEGLRLGPSGANRVWLGLGTSIVESAAFNIVPKDGGVRLVGISDTTIELEGSRRTVAAFEFGFSPSGVMSGHASARGRVLVEGQGPSVQTIRLEPVDADRIRLRLAGPEDMAVESAGFTLLADDASGWYGVEGIRVLAAPGGNAFRVESNTERTWVAENFELYISSAGSIGLRVDGSCCTGR